MSIEKRLKDNEICRYCYEAEEKKVIETKIINESFSDRLCPECKEINKWVDYDGENIDHLRDQIKFISQQIDNIDHYIDKQVERNQDSNMLMISSNLLMILLIVLFILYILGKTISNLIL